MNAPARSTLVAALFFSVFAAAFAADAPPATNPKAADKLPWEDMRLLADVMQLVKEQYVEPVDDKTLIQGAIRGLLGNLDPHSDFLDKSEFAQMQDLTSDQFDGVGLEVEEDNGAFVVVSPIDGTPAARAGIQPGDQLLQVNGTALDGLSLDQASDLLRGKPGTAVTLTLLPAGAQKPLDVKLVREAVKTSSVQGELLEPGYGAVRISQFSDDTGPGVVAAVKNLVKKNSGLLSGLVLDLRNNPGGLLDPAVEVSDAFLDDGVIVSAKGRAADSNFVRRAVAGDLLGGAPLIVLVNGGTASAAEIVAGALQDNHRALIVGTQTFGKGSVQTVIPMAQGGAIKLTTALYYTPSGKSIQAEGIVPDVELAPLKVAATDEQDETGGLKESNLSGHLANAAPAAAASKGASGSEGDLADRDFELYQALSVLKGVAAFDVQHKKKVE
ncbi:MAG TPA: S41 family peptidase [Gammaproteobacteria bacterium]|nr:S41 family peptidase [Gammaproteobacteria bacterium]